MKINNFNFSINISPQNGRKNFGAYINPDTLRAFRQELSEYDNLEYIKKSISVAKNASKAVKNLGCKNTRITISQDINTDNLRRPLTIIPRTQGTIVFDSPFFESKDYRYINIYNKPWTDWQDIAACGFDFFY